MTRTATVGIVQDVSDLVKDVSECIKLQVQTCLRQNGIDYSAVPGLSDVFSSSNEVTSYTPHDILSTAYLLYTMNRTMALL